MVDGVVDLRMGSVRRREIACRVRNGGVASKV